MSDAEELDERDEGEDEVDLDDDGDDLSPGYEAGDVNTVGGRVDYEAGDVNTVNAASPGAAPSGGGPGAGMPVAVLEYLARSLADEPDAVAVRQEARRGSTVLRLHVAPSDMGRVIGRRGRTAQAIRTLVGAAGARSGVQATVDIVDD